MAEAYINLKYFNNKIQINYHLSKDARNNFRTTGTTSSFSNIEETKNKLSKIIKDSHEKRITLYSKIYTTLKNYSLIETEKLQDIKDFLKKERPDISFRLIDPQST